MALELITGDLIILLIQMICSLELPLANVELTQPYGHSGSLVNLEDAIIGHFDPFFLIDFEN